jgi:hypothetical protein
MPRRPEQQHGLPLLDVAALMLLLDDRMFQRLEGCNGAIDQLVVAASSGTHRCGGCCVSDLRQSRQQL